uniref:Uncharacterized protein n=1 Tax=Anguilla anguilla TaxID=7936 RepID=A0A0E9Q429_ANGAN
MKPHDQHLIDRRKSPVWAIGHTGSCLTFHAFQMMYNYSSSPIYCCNVSSSPILIRSVRFVCTNWLFGFEANLVKWHNSLQRWSLNL